MNEHSSVPDGPEEGCGTALGYRFLSAAYRYPEAGNLATAAELWRSLDDGLRGLTGSRGLSEVLDASPPAPARVVEGLEQQFVTLFGHTVQGPCPPYETEYGHTGERLQQPHEISDLVAFYRAFNLDLADGLGERPDHLSLECEFLAFLCLKEAYARTSEDAELAGLCTDARSRFLRDHLGRWLPSFCGLLLKEAGAGFYPALSRWAREFVAADCRRHGVTPGGERLGLRLAVDPPDACSTCGLRTEAQDR